MARDSAAGCSRAGCSRYGFEVATVGFIFAPVMAAHLVHNPDNDSERLTAIILQGEPRDHMQIRQARRMPVFVAKKSQYRNCLLRERVAFSHGCAGGGE